jgi:hypothetical protein
MPYYITYALATYFADGVAVATLDNAAKQLTGWEGIVKDDTNLKFIFSTPPDAATRAAADGVVASYNYLPDYKIVKIKELNARTEEMVAKGFLYPPSSMGIFSLSFDNQLNMIGTNVLSTYQTFPIRWNTLDGLSFHDIVDSADLLNMILVAGATKKAIIDSGTALKNQVRDASTIAAVDAIQDNR